MAIISHNDIRPDGLRIFYGTAPPGSSSDGTYYTGDTIVNIGSASSSPYAAAPWGWKCVAGGTPGNWVASGVTANPETFGPFNGSTAVAPQNAYSFSWPCDANYIITGVTVSYNSAAAAGSIQIERDIGSTPVGSGVVQLTTAINLASTSNVVYAGVLVGSPAIFSGNLDRLGIVFSGTVANLAALGGCLLNIQLVRTV
jgi:hypothetical protein